MADRPGWYIVHAKAPGGSSVVRAPGKLIMRRFGTEREARHYAMRLPEGVRYQLVRKGV
jgi:hypothetical protein